MPVKKRKTSPAPAKSVQPAEDSITNRKPRTDADDGEAVAAGRVPLQDVTASNTASNTAQHNPNPNPPAAPSDDATPRCSLEPAAPARRSHPNLDAAIADLAVDQAKELLKRFALQYEPLAGAVVGLGWSRRILKQALRSAGFIRGVLLGKDGRLDTILNASSALLDIFEIPEPLDAIFQSVFYLLGGAERQLLFSRTRRDGGTNCNKEKDATDVNASYEVSGSIMKDVKSIGKAATP
ncbi:hypothetical protein B0T26DRAFT_750699 [Lasiosphaeria miniovina]|uniref:Uncharacterized protein n=1 Tax=Lasiosphaeria miniovina TaxID=1954250 RepID=A0AA40E478_9PEZI|nr:uncharacterized protein B0T26DRAFT_750699 [Lasiosphaeria miniovina]KAK0723426.1 hypothetical protein B0T26DRAFT_750699 [Lasiosphaeria miniovina]